MSSDEIAQQLRDATPCILDATWWQGPDGWEALLRLNPNMASAHAEEQGLADPSLAAAITAGAVRTAPAAAKQRDLVRA